jgi:hypothetical protein
MTARTIELRSLSSSAKAAARDWNSANAKIAEGQAERDRSLWRFLRRVVKIARVRGLRSAKKVRQLIGDLNPALKNKALSRYLRIVREILARKPAGVSIREWVKRQGGISRFKPRRSGERKRTR